MNETKMDTENTQKFDHTIKSEFGNDDMKDTKKSTELKWSLGQLAWAQIGNYPFWPCIVTRDPQSSIYHKMKCVGRSNIVMIHVQFFGDNGSHSWVSSNSMLEFIDLADFKKTAKSITPAQKKRDPKYAAAFVVKLCFKIRWEDALYEAMQLKSMPIEHRIKLFNPEPKASKSFDTNVQKSQPQEKVEEINQDNDLNTIAKLNQDKQSPVEKLDTAEQRNQCQKKMQEKVQSKQKRPAQDQNSEKTSQESNNNPNKKMFPVFIKDAQVKVEPKKPRIIMEKKVGQFDNFYEKMRDIVIADYSDVTEKQVESYLKKIWDYMDPEERKRYVENY